MERVVYLAEAAYDERGSGNYAYGKVGDQTGEEVRIRVAQAFEFTKILRYPKPAMREKFAEDAREIALNDHIGYAQYGEDSNNYAGRYGLWYAMHGADRFSQITVDCNVDCSAMVADILIKNGLSCSRFMRTATEVDELTKLGFVDIPFALESCEVGDILWRQGHTATVITVTMEEEKMYKKMIHSSVEMKTWSTGAGVNTRRTPYVAVRRAELGFSPKVIMCQEQGEILCNTQWMRDQSEGFIYCSNHQNDASAGIAVGKYSGYFNPDAATLYIPVRRQDKDYIVIIYG